MEYKDLKQILDIFFENPEIKELTIKFGERIEIEKNKLKELIGVGDLINGYENNSVKGDEYEYYEQNDIYAKILIEYFELDNEIYIKEIHAWREKKS